MRPAAIVAGFFHPEGAAGLGLAYDSRVESEGKHGKVFFFLG